MKKLIVAAVISLALMFSTGSYAGLGDSIDLNKLTDAQIMEIKAKAVELQKANAENTSPAGVAKSLRVEASEWGILGKNMGVAMISMAKEMGIAVEEFSKTDIGKIATAIIIYKIVGKEVINMIVGFLCLTVGLFVTYRSWRSATVESTHFKYIDRQIGAFKWQKKVIERQTTSSGESYVCMTTLAVVFAAAFLIVGFTKISG